MADTDQTLKEFIDNLLSDLSEGRISVYDALAASNQYAYLRDALIEERASLSQAELSGEADLSHAFVSVISRVSERLNELPNFHGQQPDQVTSEKDVLSLGELRKYAAARVKQSLEKGGPSKKAQRREFIHNLVTRFSSKTPISEARMGAIADQALIAAATEATSQQTKDRFIELLVASSEISSLNLSSEERDHLRQDIRAAVSSNDAYITEVTRQNRRAAAIVNALYNEPDLRRPDVFVDIVLNAPDDEPSVEVFTRAEKLSRLADSLEQHPGEGSLRFFSTEGTRGLAKGLQQGADSMLSLVGEPLRGMVLREKVSGTFRSMLGNVERFTDRLGENFVKSALFTHIAQDLSRQLSEKPRGGQVRTVFDDMFSTVFRGPLSPVLSRGTEERILDYFELARANAAAPRGRSFLPAGILPWDMFRFFDFRMGTRRESASGGWWSKSIFNPFFALSALTGFFGNAVGSFVDRTTSFFLSSPVISRQVTASRRATSVPTPITQDMPLLTALIVVITLILMYVLPSPINVQELTYSVKTSAIFSSLRKFGEDAIIDVGTGIGEVTTFVCTWNGPTPPTATITTCPVRAPISQGPFNPGGSHKTLNAWDFAAGQGTPIRSAHDAYIASYNNSYAPNQYKYGSYGNNVVLVATDPKTNQQYCTNYAHMLDVSAEVVANSGKPSLIPAGTVIGTVDTTGYTYGSGGPGTGTHLHWGYKGPNQGVPMPLPPGCP